MKAFKGRNYGVGCPGGVEVVAHSLRDTLERHAKSKLALLKREHFMKAVREIFPAMSSWTRWCYGQGTILLYDHEDII